MAVNIFLSYSHEDEAYRDQLEKHLALLRHQRLVSLWHDRRIAAGQNFADAIDAALDTADIVLLLVSASFLASSYCYSREMARALERQREGSAIVIPVIVRPCDWHSAPFGELLATPTDGKALTQWPDMDAAFTDVVRTVRRVVEARAGTAASVPPNAAGAVAATLPRSSNMRLRRTFSELERDQFLRDAFDYMARFFPGSLAELRLRHADVDGVFRQIDAHNFTCSLYRSGKRASECAVSFVAARRCIAFSYSAAARGDNFNESVSVEADDQVLYLRPLGLTHNAVPGDKLSFQGAAELFWGLLLAPMQ